jgi:D-hexose-6-phosphate mutarotase
MLTCRHTAGGFDPVEMPWCGAREAESLTLTLALGDGDVGSPFWPEPFRAIYTVVFAQTLSLRLAVQNRATHPITFEEALHAYFAISDITGIAISGLAGTTYIDKTDATRRKPQTARQAPPASALASSNNLRRSAGSSIR